MLQKRSTQPALMHPVSWQDLLPASSTADEVLALARDVVSTMDPLALAMLPSEVQPHRLGDAHDLGSYAYDLLRYRYDDADACVAETIQELAAFFSRASMRLSQLAAPDYSAQLWKMFG